MRTVSLTYENRAIEDAEAIADYLDASAVLYVGAGRHVDEIRNEAGRQVPIGVASDGVFAWPLATNYYVRTYSLAPDPDLAEHIRQRDYTPPRLSEGEVSSMREELVDLESPDGEESGESDADAGNEHTNPFA